MKRTLLFGIICFTILPVFGQNWTGAVSSDWNNAANWSATPSNGDDITIDPANYTGAMAQPLVSGTSNFTPGEMLVQNGAELTISGTLNTTDRVEIIGAGTIVTITASGSFSLIGGGNNARLIFVDDAHLQMEGGNLSCGQRLLFELGATGVINNGTVVVGETIALVDGSITGSSKLTQNGGLITTNAEFGFENEAGVYFPTFEQNGGTLQINGALVWLGATPGAGKGYFRSNNGTVKITGTIGNDPTSTMGMHLELKGASTLLEYSGSSVQLLTGDSVFLDNQATWKELNTVLWQNAGVVFHQGNSLFQTGNSILNGNGIYQFSHVTIPTGKSLNHISPLLLSVSGNLDVLGSFSHNSNKLALNGTKHQTVHTASGNLNLFDIRVNNAANGPADGGYGIDLQSSLTISNQLELTDGIIVSAASSVVKLADNATLTGGSDSTFITGYVEKTGNDAFEFPLGETPDRYRPFSISAPNAVSSLVKVGYKHQSYSSLTPVETPLQSVSILEFWDFTNSIPADFLQVTVGWNDAAQSGLNDCGDLSLTVWNGTQWSFVPSLTSGLCNGANAGTLFSTGNLPANGPVSIGFTNNVTQQYVTLCPGDSVNVGTNAYSQSGTYFDILQNVNGDDSTVITVVNALSPLITGITNNIISLTVNAPTATSYQWIDCTNGNMPISGETSATFIPASNGTYAVIVTNSFSCTDTSACEIINQLGIQEWSAQNLRLFPNPLTNGEYLQVNSILNNVVIESLDGKTIPVLSVFFSDNETRILLPVLSKGIYILRTEDGKQSSRFTVN